MTIGLKAGQLDIRVGAPDEFRNHTKGLMGVFNGDPTDDLQAPGDNTVALSNTSSEWAIYYDFGEKCTFSMLSYQNTSAYNNIYITHLVNYSSSGSVTAVAGIMEIASRTLVRLYESRAADRGGDDMIYHWRTAESNVG